jgi:type VI secretion system protein ImpH
LPVAYTELLIDRRNQFRDSTGHQFLDLFTHRAVSLFYQAWRKHRFYLPYEAGKDDGFSRNLLDLVGVGLGNLQQRLQASGGGIPDRFLLHYAGLLSKRPVSAANIAALVHGYFAVDAQLEQFVGQWMRLPPHEQSSLGGASCCLGRSAFVGERLWDRQTKVCIRLGPLDRAQFAQFMPGQPGLAALRELIQFCVGFTLDCEVALILKREAVPPPVLQNTPTSVPLLGYNLWLNSRPSRQDADDVRFGLLNNDGRR